MSNKKLLLTGGGSKLGLFILKKYLEDGYDVDLLTSSDIDDEFVLPYIENGSLNIIKVIWWELDEKNVQHLPFKTKTFTYDVIIFNHSTGGGPNETVFFPHVDYTVEEWNLHYFINTQLPFFLLKSFYKKIKNSTKVVWMLNSLIDGRWEDGWQYGGFTSFKTSNVNIMRGFARFNPGIYFGIVPGDIPHDDRDSNAYLIKQTIESVTKEQNGEILFRTGHEFNLNE